MRKWIMTICLSAAGFFIFQPPDVQARSTPVLLDHVLKGAVDAVDQTVGGVSDSVNQTVNGVTGTLEQTVNGTLTQTQQAVRETLDTTGEAAGGLLMPVTQPTADTVEQVVHTVEQVVQDTNGLVRESVDIPMNTLPQVTEALNGKAADPVGTLLEETGQVVKTVDRTVQNAVEQAGQVVGSVGEVTEGVGGTVGGIVQKTTDAVQEAVKPVTDPGGGKPVVPVSPTAPPTPTPKPPVPVQPPKVNDQDPGDMSAGQTPTAPAAPPERTADPVAPNSSSAFTQPDSNSQPVTEVIAPSQQPATSAVVVEVERPANAESGMPNVPVMPDAAQADNSLAVAPGQEVTASAARLTDVSDPAPAPKQDSGTNAAGMTGEEPTFSDPETELETVGEDPANPSAANAALGKAADPSNADLESATQTGTEAAQPLAKRAGRANLPPAPPGLLTDSAPARGVSGSPQGGSGSAGPQPPIAQLHTGFDPVAATKLYRLKAVSDTEGSQWINAPPFSPPKQAPFLT
ncbi:MULTISPECIES: hypothetical protein [Saccharibacillus]|uniref:hypothetical protein n=1 Tax=Saccharibacillus TaxID=456492 RepID=UPI00123A5866|nr:hypothetical protein [Saccharibacillus sp. WB 17]MWJ33547.1 hypothetical protein [Saccharibacillus sp. WB 17]